MEHFYDKTNNVLTVNIFDGHCTHEIQKFGYFTSSTGREPKTIKFLDKLRKFDGVTIFTDTHMFDPIVDEVDSPVKVAWCLESPAVAAYAHANIEQVAHKFKYVFTYREDLVNSDPEKFIPQSPGGCRINDKDIGIFLEHKNRMCSMVLSDKGWLEGHRLRHEIKNMLSIDSYGSGSARGWLEDKSPALKNYMFHVVVENTRSPYYFTEKLIDALASGCLPLYWGCTNIGEYFNPEGFLCFNSIEELKNLELSEELYYSKIRFVKENYLKALEYLSSDDVLCRKLCKRLFN